jgi:hypothetical protein
MRDFTVIWGGGQIWERKWPLFGKSGAKTFFDVGPPALERHGPSLKKFFASFFQKRSASFLF